MSEDEKQRISAILATIGEDGKDWRGDKVLKVGKFAFDTQNSSNVQMLERIEAWGYISYRVFGLASGHVYKLSEDQLKEDDGT